MLWALHAGLFNVFQQYMRANLQMSDYASGGNYIMSLFIWIKIPGILCLNSDRGFYYNESKRVKK